MLAKLMPDVSPSLAACRALESPFCGPDRVLMNVGKVCWGPGGGPLLSVGWFLMAQSNFRISLAGPLEKTITCQISNRELLLICTPEASPEASGGIDE